MQKHNYLIGAAVATVLAAGYANAAVPTVTQAAAPAAQLVIAGSSAAQSSIANSIENDLCGGATNTLVVQSNAPSNANKNFFAYSCFLATAVGGTPGIAAGQLVTIFYRSEGGSVMGAMPIAASKQILRLNLSDSSCTSSGTAGSCTVTGVTSTNGPSDSWAGAVVEDTVQLGVTDVEPSQLVGADFPTNYTVFPAVTPAQMAALPTVRAVQQVFGIAVNVSGLHLTTPGVVNLSRESVANILKGSYSDWSSVPDASNGNNAVSSTPATITRVDREPGSGTRTATNIYFLNYGCGSSTAIVNNPGEPLNYSTGDELTLANNTPGAIAYASIDNLLPPKNASLGNLVLASINGITPNTLLAASGAYDFWYEATLVPNPATSGASANLSAFLQTDVPKLSGAPLSPDINVIPGVGGNVGTVAPLTSRTGTATIYVNPYTRNGHSCSVPVETN